GTGFGAAELLRLLATHPFVELVSIVSGSQAGHKVGDHHHHLASYYHHRFSTELNTEKHAEFARNVIFCALPHGSSAQAIIGVLATMPEVNVVDLSGDLRLKEIGNHRTHYRTESDEAELRSI